MQIANQEAERPVGIWRPELSEPERREIRALFSAPGEDPRRDR
jgi:hypothetical protein